MFSRSEFQMDIFFFGFIFKFLEKNQKDRTHFIDIFLPTFQLPERISLSGVSDAALLLETPPATCRFPELLKTNNIRLYWVTRLLRFFGRLNFCIIIVSRAQKKKTQVRLLPPAHSTQLALLSPICTCSKRPRAGNAP